MDLSSFVKIGDNRLEAYDSLYDLGLYFDEDYRTDLSYNRFCEELDKGYGKSKNIRIARLYEDEKGAVWYNNAYAA